MDWFSSVGELSSSGHGLLRHPRGLALGEVGDCLDVGVPWGVVLAARIASSPCPASEALRLKFKVASRSILRLLTKELRLDCGVITDLPDF